MDSFEAMDLFDFFADKLGVHFYNRGQGSGRLQGGTEGDVPSVSPHSLIVNPALIHDFEVYTECGDVEQSDVSLLAPESGWSLFGRSRSTHGP